MQLFAERLRRLREEHNMTQQDLADKVGCSKGLISFYENAKREPGFTMILKLSRLFKVPPAYLMGNSNLRLAGKR